MMESFEQRMRAARHGSLYGIDNQGFVDFVDAIKLARDADAALAAKDAQIANRPFTAEQLKDSGIVLVNMQHGTIATPQRFLNEQAYSNKLQDEIARLTALNSAKDELIQWILTVERHNGLTAEASAHGDVLRARIRRLENG